MQMEDSDYFSFFTNETLMLVCVLSYTYMYAHRTNACIFNNFLLQQRDQESVAVVWAWVWWL